MKIFPAIDLIGHKAVRLKKGDYSQMTVYSDSPVDVAQKFRQEGAEFLHVVDLEGARDGGTPNFEIIKSLISESGLSVEVGGGIRNEETVKKYIDLGAQRVILGTAAVSDPDFLEKSVRKFGDKIAVGVDIKESMVAVKGWRELSRINCFDFCASLEKIGVKTVICTDISKDGMLSGTNTELYKRLCEEFKMNFIASGGVTTVDDIKKLCSLNLYGAILGKALYAGTIDLADAVKACKDDVR